MSYFLFGNSIDIVAILYGHTSPLFFLIGPMLLFYVKSTLNDKICKITKKDWLHFVPFIICLISIFPYYFKSYDSKLEIARLIVHHNYKMKEIEIAWLYPNSINIYSRVFFMFLYALASFMILFKQKMKQNENLLNARLKQQQLIIRWLSLLSATTAFLSINYGLTLFKASALKMNTISLFQDTYFIFAIIGYAIIPTMILMYPEIMYGIPRIRRSFYLSSNYSK